MTKKLSLAQQRLMTEVESKGSSSPPWGYASAGRDASARHRTARSLQTLGLVNVQRTGGGNGHRAVKNKAL